jgi:mono/diheme cytochrome c family protein
MKLSPANIALMMLIAIPAAPALAQGDPVNGKTFVEKNCARCHAVGLNDDSHLPEAPPLRHLHNRYPIDSLTEAFAEGIVTGHPKMPQFQLDLQTIDDMLAYIKSLAGPGE